VPHDLIKEIEHIVLRTHFINPVYLPTLKESFLAKDFDFGDYLARTLGQAITKHLKIHFITLLSALPLLTVFFLLLGSESFQFYLDSINFNIESTAVMQGVMMTVFFAALSMFFYVRYDLHYIRKVLSPQILLD